VSGGLDAERSDPAWEDAHRSSGRMPGGREPILDDTHPPNSAPGGGSCKSCCKYYAPYWLCKATFRRQQQYAHMFAHHLSEASPILRTDVPITANLNARAAHARCSAADPLVSLARGRLRRRLGGRPERAQPDCPPAPSTAAWATDRGATNTAPSGRTGPAVTRMSLSGPQQNREPCPCAHDDGGPPEGGPRMKKPAASYSPRPLRAKYHRR
jgi:hypothetical protein